MRYGIMGTFLYPPILYPWSVLVNINLIIFYFVWLIWIKYGKISVIIKYLLGGITLTEIRISLILNFLIEKYLMIIIQISVYWELHKNIFLWFAYRYKWLDGALPGTTKKIIVKKMVLDQFLMTPQLLVVFYTGMTWFEYYLFALNRMLLIK